MASNSSKPSSDAGFKGIRAFFTLAPAQPVITPRQGCGSAKDSPSKPALLMFECSGDRMQLTDKQAALANHRPNLTERHRAPNGVPAQAKTWTGGEGTQSRAIVMKPVSMRCQIKAPCGLWSRICNGEAKLLWPREVVFAHLHAKRQ